MTRTIFLTLLVGVVTACSDHGPAGTPEERTQDNTRREMRDAHEMSGGGPGGYYGGPKND